MEVKKLCARKSVAWGKEHEDCIIDYFRKQTELAGEQLCEDWLLGIRGIRPPMIRVWLPRLCIIRVYYAWRLQVTCSPREL